MSRRQKFFRCLRSSEVQVKLKLQKCLVLSPQAESCLRGWLEDKKYLSEKDKCIYIYRLKYRWKQAKVVNLNSIPNYAIDSLQYKL